MHNFDEIHSYFYRVFHTELNFVLVKILKSSKQTLWDIAVRGYIYSWSLNYNIENVNSHKDSM